MGGGVEFVLTRAKPLIEGRSAERGVGMGGGVSPLPIWKKIEIRDCLDVFWSTPNSTLVCVFAILKEQIFDIIWSLTYVVMLQMVIATV